MFKKEKMALRGGKAKAELPHHRKTLWDIRLISTTEFCTIAGSSSYPQASSQAHIFGIMKSTILTTAFLAFTSLATAAVTPHQSSLQSITDSYVFSISISQFISNRNSKTGPADLDWTSDGCSSSPDNPFGFDCKNKLPKLPRQTKSILLLTYGSSYKLMLPPRLWLPQF